MSFCFRLLVRALFFADYGDMQCGGQGFRREAAGMATVGALGNLAEVIAKRCGYPRIFFAKVAGQWTIDAGGDTRASVDASSRR